MTSYRRRPATEGGFPADRAAVYALSTAPVIMRNGEALPTEDVLLVDNLFFDVLQFPLVAGRSAHGARQVGSVVLTQSEARRIFGDANADRPDGDA